jgi:nucleotide-binding universal stress UspA family protein
VVSEVNEVVDVDGGIVVGHDGSKSAHEALVWAGRLALRADLDLHVVRSWSMMTAPRPSTWTPAYVPAQPEWEEAVLQELTKHVRAARLDPAVRVTCHVVHKPPAQGLMRAAEGRTCWSLAPAATAASQGCCSVQSVTSSCTTRRAR